MLPDCIWQGFSAVPFLIGQRKVENDLLSRRNAAPSSKVRPRHCRYHGNVNHYWCCALRSTVGRRGRRGRWHDHIADRLVIPGATRLRVAAGEGVVGDPKLSSTATGSSARCGLRGLAAIYRPNTSQPAPAKKSTPTCKATARGLDAHKRRPHPTVASCSR